MFMEYAMSNWHNGNLSSPEVTTKIFDWSFWDMASDILHATGMIAGWSS